MTDAFVPDQASADHLAAWSGKFMDLAIGSFDRAKNAATAVAAAGATIGTLYTGVLGLVFAAKDGAAFPLTGMVAPLFLGAAVVLSAAYLAFTKKYTYPANAEGYEDPGEDWDAKIVNRTAYFVGYVSEMVSRRVALLRASVIALGVGLVAMVLPFADLGSQHGVIFIAALLAGILITVIGAVFGSTDLTPLGTSMPKLPVR